MPVKLTVGRHAIRATASLFRVREGRSVLKFGKRSMSTALKICMAARCNAMSSSLQKTLWTQNTHVQLRQHVTGLSETLSMCFYNRSSRCFANGNTFDVSCAGCLALAYTVVPDTSARVLDQTTDIIVTGRCVPGCSHGLSGAGVRFPRWFKVSVRDIAQLSVTKPGEPIRRSKQCKASKQDDRRLKPLG